MEGGLTIADRYEVLSQRSGGEGRLLEAVDQRHGRRVALKLRPLGPDRERMLAEARVLLDLRPHPNLPVAREDFFWADDYVLVTDWVDGVDLGAAIRPVPEVLLIARQVADALDHLHTHEPPLVHGDVKPANIVLDATGRAVLVDLGLARAGSGQGTVGFVAPEVAGGATPAPPADVYGLAATVFALLAGHPPIAGGESGIDDNLLNALRAGLATDPSSRPPSASALVQSMQDSMAGDLPEGVVTFMFTDVEGSTRLWDERATVMARALADHDAVVATVVAAHGGRLLKSKGEGDSTVSTFGDPAAAVLGAVDLQRAFARLEAQHGLPLRVRIAVHQGSAELRDGDYFGPTLNRTARLRAVAHGGQIVVSEAVADAVGGAPFVDLGMHRLRDLSRPEHVFQVTHPDLRVDFPPLLSLSARVTNLPSQATSFVGREDEMARVEELLGLSRLVTLTGPGGSGKSRLALQAGAELLDQFSGGVWLVELAPLAEAGLVPNTVAAALGIARDPSTPPTRALIDALAGRRVLIILDNCEHVIDAAAELVQAVLDGCPQVRILATSRERLRLAAEALWPVPVLALPSAGDDPLASEAVRLFCDRASAARPGFEFEPAVVEICRRLDGIPLAIELAAARVGALSPRKLARRLDDKFAVLTGGSRGVLPRQRSLRAMIEWSHDLLEPVEQTTFRRLSVFRGGWTLDAAERVVDDGFDVLDALAALVDKSLVQHVDDRYQMLETVREYGDEQLGVADELVALQRRHAEEMARLADDLWGRRNDPWESLIHEAAAEFDNLVGALGWSCQHDAELAGRIFGSMWGFWQTTGLRAEAVYWARQVGPIAAQMTPTVRAATLAGAGVCVGYAGDPVQSIAWLEVAVAAGRMGETRGELAYALLFSAAVNRILDHGPEARSAISEAMAIAETLDDDMLLGLCLIWSSWIRSDGGDRAEAQVLVERAERLAERRGNAVVLGYALDTRSSWNPDPLEREALARRTGELARARGDTYGVAASDHLLARLAVERGDLETAIALLEGVVAQGDMGHARQRSFWVHDLASSYHLAGRPADAWDLLRPGLEGDEALAGLDRSPYLVSAVLVRRDLGDVAWAAAGVRELATWLLSDPPADGNYGFGPRFLRAMTRMALLLGAGLVDDPSTRTRLVAASALRQDEEAFPDEAVERARLGDPDPDALAWAAAHSTDEALSLLLSL